MKVEIRVVSDPETLKRWNFKEDAIEFYNEHLHSAIPISKVSGLGLKRLLYEFKLAEINASGRG